MSLHFWIVLIFVLFAAYIPPAQAAEVSYSNIKAFWEATYDTDKDGSASLADFIDYFRFI
jgi:hypothetical protein